MIPLLPMLRARQWIRRYRFRVGDFCFTFRTYYLGIQYVCELLFSESQLYFFSFVGYCGTSCRHRRSISPPRETIILLHTSPDFSTSQREENPWKTLWDGVGNNKQRTSRTRSRGSLWVSMLRSFLGGHRLPCTCCLFEGEESFGGLDGADWVDIPALCLGECLGLVIFDQWGWFALSFHNIAWFLRVLKVVHRSNNHI